MKASKKEFAMGRGGTVYSSLIRKKIKGVALVSSKACMNSLHCFLTCAVVAGF